MTTNNQENNIAIMLFPKEDNQTKSFDANNLIHSLEYRQVTDILRELVKESDSYSPKVKNNLKRIHNTLTLSGSRGSGKTSFLLSLKNEIENGVKDECLNDALKCILFLDIIDPTLIEEKGHIFLNIVARIKSLIDIEVEDKKLDPNGEVYIAWYETLKKLAAGLPMLDGINGGLDPSDWNDTTFVMMNGLKRVDGANNLEWYFHQYIHQSLEILEKKCVIIAFDDVDTDFSKGWPVLEVLRRYLTSPQVVTFLSGDLNLYSFLVRKKQWTNFGKALLINEYDKGETDCVIYSNEYPELVEKLESQYMLKLLKPEYRITLSTIASKLRTNQVKISVKNGDFYEGEIIEAFFHYLKEVWAINGLNTGSTYISFFTNLPLRTQLALFNTFFIQDDVSMNQQEKLAKIARSMSDIFHSELRTANVDIWELVNGYGLTNIFLLRFLLDNKKMDEASQFFPKLSNPSLDGAVTALGAVLSERIHSSPFEIFDHIIRVSNIVAKVDKWEMNKKGTNPNINDFVVHSRSLHDYGLKKIASLQSAYIVSFADYVAKNEGLIPLKSLQSKTKQERNEDDLRIDELFDETKPVEQILAMLPVFAAQDVQGNNNTFFSFYNIIAAIGDILFLQDSEMRNEFVRIGQFREYPLFTNSNQRFNEDLFDFEGNNLAGEEDDISSIDNTTLGSELDNNVTEENNNSHVGDSFVENENLNLANNETDLIGDFIGEMIAWKKIWTDSPLKVPPYLLGRIMVRAHYSFVRIPQKKTIGELLHRQLVVFLNAFLVEEVMENSGNSTLRLTNPTESDNYFIENYRHNTEKKHPLFDFLISCPIIKAYLDTALFSKLGLEIPTMNIYSSIETVKQNNKTARTISFEKYARTVKNTDEDANRIVDYLYQQGLAKEMIDLSKVDEAIRILFGNSRVQEQMKNNLLEKVKNSSRW